jgi:hypothetical protein
MHKRLPLSAQPYTQQQMAALKATRAREITKESVTEAETLAVNGVPVFEAARQPDAGGRWSRLTTRG